MKDIDNILEKYFEGETSLDEERLLKSYFQGQNIAPEHLIYAPIFQHLSNEQSEATEQLKPKERKRLPLWLSAAACAAILIGIFLVAIPQWNAGNASFVYVDGKKYKNIDEINTQALNSLMAIEEETDDELLESQINILDSFIEMDINN